MNWPKKSIAFRLIAAVLAVELASSLLVAVLSLAYERHIHLGAFDAMLRGRADAVLGAVQDAEDVEDNVMLDKADLRLPSEDVYEVYDDRGRLLGRSESWPADPPPGLMTATSAQLAATADSTLAHLRIGRQHYRLILLHGSRIVDPNDPGGGKLHTLTVVYGAPSDRVWHSIDNAVEFYAAGSILLLAVTGPLIAWLLHRGLLPVRQLAALAARVSVNDWQFTPPENARTTPELAPLTRALESVLARLECAFVQQRTFVSDAAHELKTAVAVAKSSVQLLTLRPRTAAEYQAGLERCASDIERLEELVGKMLTLARVESAAARSSAAPGPQPVCDLAECLRETIAGLESMAALHRVTISVDNAKSEESAAESYAVHLALGDCSLVTSNLLLNALEHSPPESRIQIRLAAYEEKEAAMVEMVIEDRGEGIDPEKLPHVFDRFYRGDPSRARSTGGAGLGLAIAKAAVESAGGSIAIASRQGAGTTVTVRLPLVKQAAMQSLPCSA